MLASMVSENNYTCDLSQDLFLKPKSPDEGSYEMGLTLDSYVPRKNQNETMAEMVLPVTSRCCNRPRNGNEPRRLEQHRQLGWHVFRKDRVGSPRFSQNALKGSNM